MAVLKLSQIASGGAINTATDTAVAVRSGTTDVLIALGTLASQSGTFSGTSSGTNTGDQLLFKTFSVAGQSDVVADTTADTLTLVAGTNITLTTDASTDSITITAAATAATAFSALTGSTNTTAAMVVGTGASIAASGSGTITATGAAAGTITGAMLSGTGAERIFGITVDGGGSTLSTGAVKATITVPITGTITKWYLSADQSGSIVVDIKRSGTSIVGGGNLPTLSSAISGNAAPSGWTSTAVTAGDIFTFNINSVSSITNINLVVGFTVT